MALPSVQSAADAYASGGSNAATKWQERTAAFSGDPTALAAQSAQKAKANYAAAIDSGRFARGLQAAGRNGWLAGVQRPEAASAYSGGISGKGRDKWAKAMGVWFPIFSSIQAQIDSMPNVTTQDAINRAAAWITQTKAAKANL
jgi:hypothetical protein